MYPIGTWFLSGICVGIPCIKEIMMMMMMMMMMIIIIIIIIIIIVISTFFLQQWRPLDPQADTFFPWK